MTNYLIGDKVFHYAYGWGFVEDIERGHDFPVRTKFETKGFGIRTESFTSDGRRNKTEPPTLSFKEYSLSSGGFNNKPKPKYIKDQILYVQMHNGSEVVIRYFSHIDQHDNVYVFANQQTQGTTVTVYSHSPKNPLK